MNLFNKLFQTYKTYCRLARVKAKHSAYQVKTLFKSHTLTSGWNAIGTLPRFRLDVWVRGAAWVLVVWSAFITTARLCTPLVNEHLDIKPYLMNVAKLPLTCRSASIAWDGWGPHLVLKDVDIRGPQEAPLMHYSQMTVRPAYVQSIFARQIIIEDITLQGISLTAQWKADGSLGVEGLDPLLNLGSETNNPAILIKSLRVVQGNLIIEQEGKGALSLTQVLMHVALTQDEYAVWAQGMIAAQTPVPFQLLLQGEHKDSQEWYRDIKGHFHIKGLPIEDLSTFSIPKVAIQDLEGLVDISLWGVLTAPHDYSGIAQIEVTKLKRKGRPLEIQAGGEFAYTKLGDRAVLIGNKLWSSRGLRTPSNASFSMYIKEDNQFDVVARDVQVGPWLDTFSLLTNTDTLQDSLESFEPDALITAMKGQYAQNSNFYKVMGTIQNAHVNATEFTPSIQGVDGVFLMDNTKGRWFIKSPLFSLAYHNQGAKPLVFSSLQGVFDWSTDPSAGWRIYVPYLKANLGDAPVSLQALVSQVPNSTPSLAMRGYVGPLDVRTVVDALPGGLMGHDTVNWCKAALLKGSLTGLSGVFRGPLNAFPFDKHEGVFEIIAPFENLSLRYEPQWPVLEQMKGALRFSNRRLDIYSSAGKVLGLPYRYAMGSIPDLAGQAPQVDVKSELLTDLNFAKDFILHSPLSQTVGKMYKHLSLQGKASLDLNLMVPLSKQDKRVTKVWGTVGVQDSQLQLLNYPIEIKNLNGDVEFTQESVSANLLKGFLFDTPAQFTLQTIKIQAETKKTEATQGYSSSLDKAARLNDKKSAETTKLKPAKELLRVQANSQITVKALEKIIDLRLSPILEGIFDYQAQVDVDMGAGEDIKVVLSSDLANTRVNLPEPFKKEFGIKSKGWVRASLGAKDQLGISAGYREDATWISTFKQKSNVWELSHGRLHFGITDNVSAAPEGKIYVDGQVSWFDVDAWKAFYKTLPSTKISTAGGPGYQFDLHFGNVKVLGATYSDVRVRAIPDVKKITLNLSGSNAEGTISIPYDDKEIVHAKMTKLTLTSSKDKLLDTGSTWPLPPLDFYSDELILNGKKLKKTSLVLTPTPSGYQIDKLQASLDHAQLDASGYWDRVSMPHQSEVKGTITTAAAGEMLKEWGYTSSLKETSGVLDFDLRWPGDLNTPDLLTMDGHINLQYEQGRVLGVDPGLGRILSLINLNTLLKRLQLDFSDIVKDGFPFDKLGGTIYVKNGRARTNDLKMEGSSARINFYGDYLLLTSMLDVDLIIIPNVSGTLPLAAAITAGNPAVGAAVWVVDRMTGGRLSEITRYYYRVSGSLDTPVIENKGQVSPEFQPKERL